MTELVVFGGKRVRGFGLGDVNVGDLLAYRQEWDPFIKAHVALWKKVNALFEDTPTARNLCPPGISSSSASALNTLDPATQSFCWSLILTRIAISDTDPGGIPHQWNAWAGKSDADILFGAAEMLKWHQQVVASVGGPYKDQLVKLAAIWNLHIELPPLPSLSTQQKIIAQIEGAWISLKGILKFAVYGAGSTLYFVGKIEDAVSKAIAKAVEAAGSSWTWVGVTVGLVAVGAGLVIYYVPRRAAA